MFEDTYPVLYQYKVLAGHYELHLLKSNRFLSPFSRFYQSRPFWHQRRTLTSPPELLIEPIMAVPDPHIEEMRILTYEPRPRSCKRPFTVPLRHDYVEVKWCIDYLPGIPDRWCTAEVLHVSRSPLKDVLATGVIRYLPDDSWDEEIHEVEFLEDFRLRRNRFRDEGEDPEHSDTGNPVTKWQLAKQRMDNSAPSDDEDWNIAKEQTDRPIQNRSVEIMANYVTQNCKITSLREGYSSLVVEVEKIKKELLNQSKMISEVRRVDGYEELCSSAGCVLQRLRHKLGLKMQAGLKSMSSTPTRLGKRKIPSSDHTLEVRTGDGIYVGAVKARVECTLLQFESVARELRSSTSSGAVLFVPDFAHTQLPLQCSAAFRILFKTLKDFTSQIGVGSHSDRLEMARKCGTSNHGDILRVLGTYSFSKADDRSAATICIGTSCGNICSKWNGTERDVAENETKYPLLIRKTREWNHVDRRFVHPLKLESHPISELEESASDMQAFSLTWKRACELGPRMWSKAMTDTKTTFGWLEASLPFIQVETDNLCREVGALAGDEEWEALFNIVT